MSITKLFLSVSVIAMFAVGSAWATTPAGTEDDTVGTLHNVYTQPTNKGSGVNDLASGIAGVTYVNRMVGVAGGAAQQAENHAAAAGAYAMDAAESANQAKSALDGKQATLVPGVNIMGAGSVSVDKDNGVITVSGTDTNTTYSAGTNVTITGANNAINVAPANGSTLGVVKAGTNTTITSGAVNVATANGATLGVVKQGTNTTITNGAVNVATASKDALGVVKVGNNIDVADGEISVPEASESGFGVVRKALGGFGAVMTTPEFAGQDGYVITAAQYKQLYNQVRTDLNGAVVTPGEENAVWTTKSDGSTIRQSPGAGLEVTDAGVLQVNVYDADMSNIPTGPDLGNYTNMVPRADQTIAALNTRVKVNQTDASDPSVSQFNIMMTDGNSNVVRASLVATDSDGNNYNQINYYGPNKAQIVSADAKKAGVMKWGQVPSGSATSTTSAQIWIE